jgi:hypothetical protein
VYNYEGHGTVKKKLDVGIRCLPEPPPALAYTIIEKKKVP